MIALFAFSEDVINDGPLSAAKVEVWCVIYSKCKATKRSYGESRGDHGLLDHKLRSTVNIDFLQPVNSVNRSLLQTHLNQVAQLSPIRKNVKKKDWAASEVLHKSPFTIKSLP